METDAYAIVLGQPLKVLPKDLYIPPNALQVILEAFSGPLDLLLYLIKKENLDILEIPIAEITAQYMQYVELMQKLQLELAGEYLVMAAVLLEIKSRMLLPQPTLEVIEEDPRAELIRRLREYERIKRAAEALDAVPRMLRDNFEVLVELPVTEKPIKIPEIVMSELVLAMQRVLSRVSVYQHHQIPREVLSVRERMVQVLAKLQVNEIVDFRSMFDFTVEGRQGVVVTFIAVLELLRQVVIEVTQAAPFGPIYVTKKLR